MKVLIKIPEEWLDKTDVPTAEEWEEIVMSGQPLPDDCEILTKEAYADLCVRASGFELKIDNTNYCPNCSADMREVEV